MAIVLKDRVKQNASAPGTGTITLGATPTGFQAFSAIGNGNITYFAIVDPVSGDWEVNYGTYSSGTLTRNATPLSSSAAGALVNFTGTALDVFCTYPSEKAIYEETGGNVLIDGGPITVIGSGVTTYTTFSAALGEMYANINSFAQFYAQNLSDGTEASADFVAYNDLGDGNTNFVDVGINSSNYTSTTYPIFTPGSAYVFNDGGEMIIGSATDDLLLFAGGVATTDWAARIDKTSKLITTKAGLSVGSTLGVTGAATFSSTVLLSADPTLDLQAATKQYVDTAVSTGLHLHQPVLVATTGNLTATYNNGASGVGATLTNSGAQVALSIDGVSLSTTNRVLVWQQSTPAQNGVYTVTTVGSGSTNWVLTRATDADTYAPQSDTGLGGGDYFYVQSGTTGAGDSYVCTNDSTITFGTTAITFAQFSGAITYVGGTNIDVTGQTISLTGTVAATNGGTGVNTVTTGDILYGSATNTWSKLAAGSAYKSLVMNAGGTNVEWNAVALNQAGAVSGALPATNGGTGLTAYTLGDTVYSSAANTLDKLAGNTTTTKKFMVQTGTGSVSAAPVWDVVNGADVNGNISGSAGSVANALTAGTFLTSTGTFDGSVARTFAVDAVSTNTASKVVARDASGNFAAGTITAALSGNATTATTSTNIAGGAANQIVYNTASGTTSFITAPTTSGTYLGWNGSAFTYSAISLPNSATFNSSGTGDASGTTFDGSAARTISYNTVGASPLAGSSSLTTTGTVSSGTWSASFGAVSGANLTNLTAANLSGTVAIANGGSGASTAATARTNFGATTLGSNLFTITNPSAVTFPRFNADNTVSALDAATFRSAIGAGTSSATGTVTSITAGSYLTGGTITTSGTIAVDATNLNTASKVVARDASGNFSAGTITASLSGNATTASSLNNALTLGTYLTGTSYNGSSAVTAAVDATSANTASKVVARDGSGNFSAGTITATLSGNASTATTATTATNQSGGTVNATTGTFSGQLAVNSTAYINTGTGASDFNDLNLGGSGGWAANESHGINTYYGSIASPTIFTRLDSQFDGSKAVMRWKNFYYSGAQTSTVMTLTATSSTTAALNVTGAITQAGSQVLTAANYTSYSPSLTGSGASGTWSINVTGSAGSASTATSAASLVNGTNSITKNTSYGWNVRSDQGTTSILLLDSAGTGRGWWYADSASTQGFLSTAGNWSLQVTDAGNVTSVTSSRAPIFYDSDNTGYYVDPSSNSRVAYMSTDAGTCIYLGNQNVTTTSRIILNWHTDADYNYVIGKRAGAWVQPMDISFYTGIRYHAHNSYGGHRFYTVGFDGTQAFSIGDGDTNVRSITSFFAPIFYDYNDTAWYVNPNSTSNLYALTVNQTISGNISGSAGSASTATTATTANALNTGNAYQGLSFTASDGTNGYFYANRSATANQAGIQFRTAGTTNWYNYLDNGSNTLGWYQTNTNTQVMSLTQAGVLTVTGEIRSTGNVTAYYSSDIKFKENVRSIPDALETVESIGGKLFDWKDDYIADHGGEDGYFVQKADFGVVAQDVLEHFPIAVRTRPDGSLAVDYEKLSALAFQAVAELSKRVKSLEARI